MSTITNYVRWASNTDELRKNLAQGLDQIEATRTAADRMVKSLQGEQLAVAANKWAAAITEVGGVTKLTAAEQDRANTIFQKYIEKQELLGRAIPSAIQGLAAEAKALVDARAAADESGASHSKLGEVLRLNLPGFEHFNLRITENIAELGKWGAAIGGLFIAFEAGKKAFEISEQVAEDAKTLRNLSTETGVAIVPLQTISAAMKDFGVTNDEVARGIYQLGRRVAGDDQSAAAALAVLGLNIRQLKSLAPDELFLTVVNAVNKVPDPLERSRLAAELFGARFGQALLAVGPELNTLIERVSRSGEVMSEDAVQAVAKFADSIDHLKLSFKAMLGEALAPALAALADFIDKQRSLPKGPFFLPTQRGIEAAFTAGGTLPGENLRPSQVRQLQQTGGRGPLASQPFNLDVIGSLATGLEGLQASSNAAANALRALREAYVPLTAVQKQFLDEAVRIGGVHALTTKIVEAGAQSLGITSEQLKAYTKQQEEAKQKTKRHAEALKEVQEAEKGYGAVLATINPAIAAAAQADLKFGISEEKVADARGLSIVQVKALAEQLKIKKELTDLTNKSTEGLASAHEHLGQVDNSTIPLLKERLKVLDEIQKIEGARVGVVSHDLLPGDTTNEIGNLKNRFEHLTEALRQFRREQAALALEFRSFVEMLQSVGAVFERVTQGHGFFQILGQGLGGVGQMVGAIEQYRRAVEAVDLAQTASEKSAANWAKAASLVSVAAIGFTTVLDLGHQIDAQQAQISAKVKALQDQFSLTFHELQQRAAEAGVSLREFQNAIDGSDAALKKLSDAFQLQDDALKLFSETVKKYKFTLKELGPGGAFEQLSEAAIQLYQEFKILTGGGVETDVALRHMGKSINDLVHQALQSGTALPEFLRPILARMIELGTLTDAAGHKIASLGDLKFSASLSSQFETLISKIEKLTIAIARAFGVSLRGLGDLSNFRTPPPGGGIGTAVPRPKGAEGGIVHDGRIQRFGWGGIADGPSWPDVIPAYVSDNEAIFTQSQQRQLWDVATGRSDAPGRRGGDVHIHMDNRGALLDSYGLKRLSRQLQNEGEFFRQVYHNPTGQYPQARASMNFPV